MPQPLPNEYPVPSEAKSTSGAMSGSSVDSSSDLSMVSVEFPAEFWAAVQGLARQAGVTPETVISAGTSLFSLAIKAKADNQKMAIIEVDQPCIAEIKGL